MTLSSNSKLTADEIRRKMRENPDYNFLKINRGEVLHKTGKNFLSRDEAIHEISQSLANIKHGNKKHKILIDKFGFNSDKAKKVLASFEEQGVPEEVIRKNFKRIEEEIGFINKTRAKKIYKDLTNPEMKFKMAMKNARKAKLVEKRRYQAMRQQSYAGSMQEGRSRIGARAKRAEAAVRRTHESVEGGERTKITGKAINVDDVSTEKRKTSILAANTEKVPSVIRQQDGGEASIRTPKAHSIGVGFGSVKKPKDIKGKLPTSLGGQPGGSTGKLAPPIGFSKKI